MSILKSIFGHSKKEVEALKQDVSDLKQFATLQMIDEKTLQLSQLFNGESTKADDHILINLWKEVPEISTVLSKITDRAKGVPWQHFKVKDKEKAGSFKKAQLDYIQGKCSFKQMKQFKDVAFELTFDPAVNKLLNNPNDLQSWGEMVEQLMSYWYVIGDSFLIKLGAFGYTPDELNVMASQQVDLKIRDSFLKNPFQINPNESAIEYYKFDNGYGKTLTYEPDLILHMRAPSLIYKNGGWAKGYSPLASAILASKTLKQEYLSRLSLVRDRGSMGMVVSDGKAQTTPSEGDTELLYKRLQKFGLGDNKSNPYAVTNGAYKWMSMSFNSDELELLTGREENLKVLSRKFNVPTDLLIGDSTFNNVNSAGKMIYTSNVMPWFSDFQKKLSKLLGLDENNEVVMPVYDDITELQQDLGTQTEIMIKQYDSNLITKDEAREGLNRPIEPESGEYKDDNNKNKDNGTTED